MKISFAIAVCNELNEIKRLVPFLLEKKRPIDEIVILYDENNGNPEVIELDEDTIVIKASESSNIVELKRKLGEIHSFVEYHKSLESQIIFIKYDPEELKYVYICDYCNTSWKK